MWLLGRQTVDRERHERGREEQDRAASPSHDKVVEPATNGKTPMPSFKGILTTSRSGTWPRRPRDPERPS